MTVKDGASVEQKEIHSFLMIGQSNMAGRGDLSDVEPIQHPLCYMLRMGRWQPLSHPVNPDRDIFRGPFPSGVSLAPYFALAYADAYQVSTGLIPCADGGTRMDQWMPGEVLYDHALMQARLAMRSSALSGILWHQGESDCKDRETVDAYGEKFLTMMTALRKDLGLPQLPIIVGELARGHKRENVEEMRRYFNAKLSETVPKLPNCYLVSSEGLTLKADDLHFDALSCQTFGQRYFDAYAEHLSSALSEH